MTLPCRGEKEAGGCRETSKGRGLLSVDGQPLPASLSLSQRGTLSSAKGQNDCQQPKSLTEERSTFSVTREGE